MDKNRRPSEHELEQALGNLLRMGVALAALIVLVGGTIYLIHHGTEPAAHAPFRGEPSDLCHVKGIVQEALALRGRGIIQLGFLVLVATPVLRVLLSVVAFAKLHDPFYVAITSGVLAILIFSLLSGSAG